MIKRGEAGNKRNAKTKKQKRQNKWESNKLTLNK